MSGAIWGYADRPSAAPGESLSIHVSAHEPGEYVADLVRLVQLDPSPEGPGMKVEEVPGVLGTRHEGRRQRTQVGSYVEVPAGARLVPRDGLGLHVFAQATRPDAGRQALLSCWSEADRRGWALTIEEGALALVVGDGALRRVRSERPLFPGVWYAIAASLDAERDVLRLAQAPVVGSANGVFGPVVPLDSTWRGEAPAGGCRPADAGVPLVIGGTAEGPGPRTWVSACFDGKLDAPRLYGRPLSDAEAEQLAAGADGPAGGLLARWDFAAGIGPEGIASDRVADVSGGGHDGTCVNQPDRAMTGWNWSGRHDLFTAAPHEYGAIAFHSDALDDCRWEPDFELCVPEDLRSGCYGVRVRQGDAEDCIPFFVRPAPGAPTAPIAVLMPTLSYAIYANFHNVYPWEGWGFDPYEATNGVIPLDRGDLALLRDPDDFGRSPYDRHADGQGVQYASWRRPIVNMRPGQAFSFNFQADFYLIDWLEAQGFAYDVVTDHDLHREGAELLRPYRAVVTGSHPEYFTWEMLDAVEGYLAGGGRGMYLGGNGFYWVTALHPDKPWLAEVRRGDTGDAAWHARPGEYHHAFTGERGGLWRHRGRAPQKLWGTGYGSHTLGISGYYVRMPDSRDERVGWIFEGIGAEEAIGDFGLVGGGAAGIELDVYDRALGTPPHALLLASSVEHDQSAALTPEELDNVHPVITGDEHPKIRADVVYFTTPGGGGVFSASAIGWSGSLSHDGYDNAVSRLTGNVLRRFAAPEPLTPVLED